MVTVRTASGTPPTNGNTIISAFCASGEVATGAGYSGMPFGGIATENAPLDDGTAPVGPSGWRMNVNNNGTTSTITLSVVCVAPGVQGATGAPGMF